MTEINEKSYYTGLSGGMKALNFDVPVEWEAIKQDEGVTWRVIMGRGITYFKEVKNMRKEIEDMIDFTKEKNEKISQLKNRIYELEEENIKLKAEVRLLTSEHN